MPSVFLSYSRSDRPFAKQVVAALEAGGCSVWWDGLIEGGERFSQTTETALSDADAVVVLWSQTSVKSHWVHDEAQRGRDRGRLVPASIDGSAPPLGFGQFQALDLSQWKGKPGAPEIAELLRAIATATGQPELAVASAPQHKAKSNRRTLLIGGGAAAVLAGGGGLAAWKYGLFAPEGERNSVAVLPFRNLSGDPAQDYFAEGIAEEVRNTLARNPLLKVIATTTSNTFRERTEALPDIARQLSVSFVLDGSVRRTGEMVRIAVQLIDAANGATRWTENFDKPFDKILATQAQIATAVLQLLNIQMSGAGFVGDLRRTGGTEDPAAFDAFLKGRAEFELFNVAGFRAGARYYAQAIALDPRYAAAYSGQARCLANLSTEPAGEHDMEVGTGRALELARKAHDIAPDSAFVNIVRGATLADSLQIREARPYYEAANRISPRHLDVPTLYGLYQAYLGNFDSANRALQRAISVDPLNPRVLMGMIWLLYWSGEAIEALALIEQLWTDNPDFSGIDTRSYFEFICYLALGRLELARKSASLAEEKWERAWQLAMVDQLSGNTSSALAWLTASQSGAAGGFNIAYNRATLLTALGRHTEAMDVIEIEYTRRNPYLIRLAIDPPMRPLSGLPRFKAIKQRIGLTA